MDDFATGYALGSDSNNNGGGSFLNGDGIWTILLFAMIFGWNGRGFGGGGFGGGGDCGAPCATQADVRAAVDQQTLISKLDQQTYGLADSTYALNSVITNGFHGVDSVLCNGFDSLSRQLSECCCENRAATAQLRYDAAVQACDTRNLIQTTARDIIDGQNANTRAILDFLTQDKIATLTAENQSLKFAASQANQNAFITANQEAQTAELLRRLGRDCPVPAYWVNPPTPVQVPNFGCGCGC